MPSVFNPYGYSYQNDRRQKSIPRYQQYNNDYEHIFTKPGPVFGQAIPGDVSNISVNDMTNLLDKFKRTLKIEHMGDDLVKNLLVHSARRYGDSDRLATTANYSLCEDKDSKKRKYVNPIYRIDC